MRPDRAFVPALLLVALAAVAACDTEVPAAELGARLFSAPAVSSSRFNKFSCATCHVVDGSVGLVSPGRFDSGYNLHGAPARRGWWGGGAPRLIDAINVCVSEFMGGQPLAPESDAARQLGAHLGVGAPAEDLPPAPLTIVRAVGNLADLKGDPARGAVVWVTGCVRCHGALHSAAGAIDSRIPQVPEATIHYFPDNARAAFIEKVRHGRFFNIGGVMPFYSLEALSDADLADLLAYVGL